MMGVDVDVGDVLETRALELLDSDTAVVEHAEARGAVARRVVQPSDRHEGAPALPLHDRLHAGERRTHDPGGRLIHAPERGRIAGVEKTRAARGTLAHELQVLGGVERAELCGARIARLEQRHSLRQSARGELARECGESVRSEWMAVTESITREALARDHGDAVHGESRSFPTGTRRGAQA